MSEQDVFILSERALTHVIDQIRDDQWDQRRPEWFQTGGQGDATLRQIVNYHAYDSAWVPDVLAGKTIAEVGDRSEMKEIIPSTLSVTVGSPVMCTDGRTSSGDMPRVQGRQAVSCSIVTVAPAGSPLS